MTDSMRSVAGFMLDMIGQCRNLDELLAVQRNPSFIRRLAVLRLNDSALFDETTTALAHAMKALGTQPDEEREARE